VPLLTDRASRSENEDTPMDDNVPSITSLVREGTHESTRHSSKWTKNEDREGR